MFGCFTRNIYVSKICLHFLCAFVLSHDSFEKGKDQERASLWWGGLVLPFQEGKLPQMWFCVLPNSCEVQAPNVIVKGVVGGALFLLHTCSPAYTMPFNLLTSICTYKQCLQRNTFTGVDWLVHNNPYLGWYGKLTVISHTNDVSDPSYYNIHWPDSVVQWFNNPFKKCCAFHQES